MHAPVSISPNMRVLDVVDQNYIYATVLRFFGVDFYRHPENTLGQICQEKGIDYQKLLKHFRTAPFQNLLETSFVEDYPIDIVLEFLKDSHQQFIWHQLPYIADLIANIDPIHFDHPELAKDLKFVFPLFAEDFIRHIYEEEATSFAFIHRLFRAVERWDFHPGRLFFDLKCNSIKDFAAEHLEEDDEMSGIRELTNNYHICSSTSTYTKVIYSELKKFEADLQIHAHLENNVLLKKGDELETKAWEILDRLAYHN